MHLLEKCIRDLLHVDTRLQSERDTFQVGAGRKRTTLRHVRVIEVGAPGIKALFQGPVANMGVTTWGALKQGPMSRSAIYQGRNGGDEMDASCWWLAAMSCRTEMDPFWCDDIVIPAVLPDGSNGLMAQLYYGGLIVQVFSSLEVSTRFNNPNDEDIRPEVLQKTVGLVRRGISDMKAMNYGFGPEGLKLLGLITGSLPLSIASIAQARSMNRCITLITTAGATNLYASHCYMVAKADLAKNLLIAWNPHDASLDTVILGANFTTKEVAGVYWGELPNPKILQRPTNPPPPPPPAPAPAPTPPQAPEVPMARGTITVVPKNPRPGLPAKTVHPGDLLRRVWNTTGAASALISTDRGPWVEVAINGSDEVPAPAVAGEHKWDLLTKGLDGKQDWSTDYITVAAPSPTTLTPPSPPAPPAEDPIVSVTITRRSGKQQTVPA